ncbi:glycosyltransferase [Candidatus Pacearchaeota archaeon]|nr:glycosyltransferase [Candidatus Pacearchaeota archaeon]
MLKNKKILFATWSSKNKNWHAYQMWDSPLRKMFGEVIVFDPQEEIANKGKDQMNQTFLKLLEKEKPDYVFMWIMFEEFYLETLEKMRAICPKTKFIEFTGDDDIKFEDHTFQLFPFFDYFFITQLQYEKWYKKATKKTFFMCGANTHEFKPIKTSKKYDVSFVGTPKSDRAEIMRFLMNNGIKIRVCGAGWEKYPEFNEVYGGKIPTEDFTKLINETRINLCLSKNYFGGPHLLERFFEINACKSFVLTEYCDGYYTHFKENEDIVSFKSKKELLEKVKYYLKNEKEREKIAKKAYNKTIKSFSSELLLKNAFKIIEKDKENTIKKQNFGKILYLKENEIYESLENMKKKVLGYDCICFSSEKYNILPYKDKMQYSALDFFNKSICVADVYNYSSLIGNYSFICSRGVQEYFGDKILNKLVKLPQLMIKKDYFIKNIEQIRNFAKLKSNILNLDNSTFISIPLLISKRKDFVPMQNKDHLYFPLFESELLMLKNNNKITKNTYILKLLLFSALYNREVLKYLMTNTLKKSKNDKMIKCANYLSKLIF